MAKSQSQVRSITSLAAGIVSIVLVAVFLFTSAGAVVLWAALALGLLAVIFGIIALVQRQNRAFALVGLIAGALSVVLGLGNLLFALLLIGAIGS